VFLLLSVDSAHSSTGTEFKGAEILIAFFFLSLRWSCIHFLSLLPICAIAVFVTGDLFAE